MASRAERIRQQTPYWVLSIATLLSALNVAAGLNDTVHGEALARARKTGEEESPKSAFDMEIVIARFSEPNLDWLRDVPEFYHITVYNKARCPYLSPIGGCRLQL